MTAGPARAELAAVLRRVAHPPAGEARFWVIQAMVVVIAAVHLEVDLHSSLEAGDFPAGIPVALLIVPVAYAALRYGLAGSAATGLWATLLWLPDLSLPHDQGHVGGLVEGEASLFGRADRVLHLADGRDYRVDPVALPNGSGSGGATTQLVFEDVTEERKEGRRAQDDHKVKRYQV